jgi:hypothetical protein
MLVQSARQPCVLVSFRWLRCCECRYAGICAGIKLQQDLNITNFVMYDENVDVGGTWLVNSYPGCACDIQSHLYSFSFELNPG